MLLFKNCLLALIKPAEGNKGTRTFLFCFLLEYSCLTQLLVQQSESATCVHISALPCLSFMLRSPQSIEQRSLYHSVGSHESSILCVAVCTHQSQPPDPSLSPFSLLGVYMFVFYFCISVSALQMSSSIPFFLDSTCMY